ncbi:hypothetical protein ACEN88_27510, partial [Massilia sp. CT11-108]|uniref:hypothetical protein n=1 Tax=Massilia sp. CT11-108 TaxID=3393900 RepID=UPI0039A70CEF
AYRAAGGHADVPPYAWPIATLAWVRVSDADTEGSHTLDLFCLGDSKVLLQLPDGTVRDLDPFENPQEQATQAAVAALVAEGILDPAERWTRLLPMLRARRHEQNTAASPAVLCLEPRGPFAARVWSSASSTSASWLPSARSTRPSSCAKRRTNQAGSLAPAATQRSGVSGVAPSISTRSV